MKIFKRNTIVSSKVLQLLNDASNPLSNQDILDLLATHDLHPNRSTVYRILDKLVETKAASVFSINNHMYFEITHNDRPHHHHFFCTECETVYCLDYCHVEVSKMDLSKFLPSKKFKITGHDFKIYGVCDECNIGNSSG